MFTREDRPPFFASASVFIIGALFVTFFVWASYAEVDEIARGDGKVIPASKTQIIQARGRRRTGDSGQGRPDRQERGSPDTPRQHGERLEPRRAAGAARTLQARIARLKHEQAGNLDQPFTCPEIEKAAPEVCDNEQKLLVARSENSANKLSVLKSRLQQRGTEHDEAIANEKRLTESLVVSDKEAELVKSMVKRGLMAQTEQIRVDRQQTELNGQLALAAETINAPPRRPRKPSSRSTSFGCSCGRRRSMNSPRRWPSCRWSKRPYAAPAIAWRARTSARRWTASSTRWNSTRWAPRTTGHRRRRHRAHLGDPARRGRAYRRATSPSYGPPEGLDQDHRLRLLDLRRPWRARSPTSPPTVSSTRIRANPTTRCGYRRTARR